MDLSVVVLNWNAAADTIACIRPLLKWTQITPAIWVVDNASADDSITQIQAALPQINLIPNPENLGFTGGTNLGVKAALEQSPAPILLLNNDARVAEADALRLCQTLQEHPDIGLIVPLLYEEDGEEFISAGGKNPAFHMQTRVHTFPNDDPIQIVETVSGTAAFTQAAMWHQAGFLEPDFFFSTEMADLSLRAKKHGFLAAVERRAKATHETNRSARFRSSLYTYYIVRNRFLVIRNHYKWHLHLWVFWLAYTAVLALKLRLENQPKTATAVWLAFQDVLARRWGGQNERVLAACRQIEQ
ncbi:MAG: glycosyltransferase family 2 protein [Chloroflexota bacterium]